MLWCAKISAFTPKITRFLIVLRGAFLLLSDHAKNHLRCWTGSKSRQRPGRARSKLFPATYREWTLRHCIQTRLERSCAQFLEKKQGTILSLTENTFVCMEGEMYYIILMKCYSRLQDTCIIGNLDDNSPSTWTSTL